MKSIIFEIELLQHKINRAFNNNPLLPEGLLIGSILGFIIGITTVAIIVQ